MGGGWIGYVYALVGCGGFAALIGASTLAVYAFTRLRGSREARVRVIDVTSRD